MNEEITRVKTVIDQFQEGYLHRDLDVIDDFMELFCDNGKLEVIGTNAFIKGQGEWCLDRKTVRKLVYSDWQNWGDLKLDTENLNIHVNGNCAWFAAMGTVSRTIDPSESYQNFFDDLKWITDQEQEITVKDKLLAVMRSGINRLAEAEKGTQYTWPIRFTAVLVKEKDQWQFCQMNFSFPTIYPPDIRLTG